MSQSDVLLDAINDMEKYGQSNITSSCVKAMRETVRILNTIDCPDYEMVFIPAKEYQALKDSIKDLVIEKYSNQ